MIVLPFFVQSRLLLGVPGFHHAFLGVDPAAGRTAAELLRDVFAVPPGRVAALCQVHSAAALFAADADFGRLEEGGRQGDAVWTVEPGTGVAVRTADCVPVLIALPGAPAAAAVHAGWRGLVSGVVAEAVRAVARRFGPGTIARLVAAVGPGARGCCYEVGEEVAGRLRLLPGGDRLVRPRPGTGRAAADLQGLAVEALLEAGLDPERVEAVGSCTICSPRFHSFRRERSLTGRQISFIYIL